MSEVLCPKCGSDQITANKKGFSGKKAVVGGLLTGGVGLLAGTIGSNKVKITCLGCGHEFKPGEGAKSKADFQQKKNAGCMVVLIAFLTVAMFVKCGGGSSDRQLTPEEQAEKERLTDSIVNSMNPNSQTAIVNTIQGKFVSEKTEEFKNQITSGASADEIKQKQKSITKTFLKEQKNKLVDWSGVIISVDMFQDVDLDISITIQDREIVGQKTISDKTMDCGITIEADQATSKKYGYKGVARKGELYEKIKALKEGDKVIFSADVVDATDNTEKTGLNLSTLLHLKITDIRKQ
ncbi:MAG: hypothetical protein WBP31_06465 [Chitinophagales bacterium]|jgi:hypothetical protein|nr:hypothetical protein [Bacteroidota bacterium]